MANYALVASYAPVASYTPVANYALMASVTLGYSLSMDIKDRLDSEDKNKETQYGRWTSNTCQDETHLSHPIDWQFGLCVLDVDQSIMIITDGTTELCLTLFSTLISEVLSKKTLAGLASPTPARASWPVMPSLLFEDRKAEEISRARWGSAGGDPLIFILLGTSVI
ncbi:hypothetical protein C8J56DRAFT_903936 [Mycena floridula]|nr:hypothetical protein C8J56DRAFT_903936 [Mycena floridula]